MVSASKIGEMSVFDSLKPLKHSEVRLAWMVAIGADVVQLAAPLLFGEGALSPADGALDVLVAFILVKLLGWHWAFLPTLAAELVPGLDLFPTWTAAVWYVSRQFHADHVEASQEGVTIEGEILPPEGRASRA